MVARITLQQLIDQNACEPQLIKAINVFGLYSLVNGVPITGYNLERAYNVGLQVSYLLGVFYNQETRDTIAAMEQSGAIPSQDSDACTCYGCQVDRVVETDEETRSAFFYAVAERLYKEMEEPPIE